MTTAHTHMRASVTSLRLPRVSRLQFAAMLCLTLSGVGGAWAQSSTSVMDQLRNASAAKGTVAAARAALPPVREAVLRDTARQLGAQAGLAEEGARILRMVEGMARELDNTYRFADVIMSGHILPPVISQANDAMSLESTVLRVATRVYRMDAPARPVRVAPTWREWLLVGLSAGMAPRVPTDPLVLPRNDDEQRYWREQLEEAYAQGVAQAQAIFDVNMNRLQRSYQGMRKFNELHARGMVTAPQLITTQSVIDREDPNTVAVGTTVFRITQPAAFVEAYERWTPLGK